MTAEFIFLLILILASFSGIFWFLARQKKERAGNNQADFGNTLLMVQNQMNEIARILDARLSESSRMFQEQYSTTTKITREVTERLVRLEETNKQVITVTDQLKNLEDILKNPKQRGILGEYYLATLLKNVFPPGMYKMQYPFSDGTIVDAAIFLKDKIIPVDSKFSLENYNRLREEKNQAERERLERVFKQDLKTRIDETAKYVRPEEGTLDFAFMFIPAEGIYYDLLVNQVGAVKANTRDLIDYAFVEKRVHIVSPTTFLAHLKMVLQGLKMLQVEESAKEIRKQVESLTKHLKAYEEYMSRLGAHLGTAVNTYNTAYKEFGKVDKDVFRITGERIETEPVKIEGPVREV